MSDLSVSGLLLGVVVAIGTGLLTDVLARALGWKTVSRGKVLVWPTLTVGVACVAFAITYFVYGGLRTVPNVSRASQDEAGQILRSAGFVPDPRPMTSREIEEGRVIPETQRPIAGQRALKGTIVSFGVSTGAILTTSTEQRDSGSPATKLTLSPVLAGKEAEVLADASGIYRASVSGTAPASLPPSQQLLLWVRPVRPPSESPGWYLQRGPINGVTSYSSSGEWNGMIQIGNREYPPGNGDVVDIAVSLCSATEARILDAISGAVVKPAPVGSSIAVAKNVQLLLR